MTIDALAAALGVVLTPPADVPWEELDRELHPLALPADLRRFWERVDVTQLSGVPLPWPSTPAFALAGWRMLRDTPGTPFPAGLFPWCYEGHEHLLIELDAPGAATGTIFAWGFGDQAIRLRYHDLGDWLAVASTLVREGTAHDFERMRAAVAERLAQRGPHPVYGTQTEFGTEPDAWPAHWRPIAELAWRDPPVRFPHHTIAEVLAARRDGPVEATVTAGAGYLGGRAGHGARHMLVDATGRIDVWFPPHIRGLGLLEPGARRYTIEIEATHWTGPEPQLQPWPFGEPAPPGTVEPTYGALLERLPPQATATIVRRT